MEKLLVICLIAVIVIGVAGLFLPNTFAKAFGGTLEISTPKGFTALNVTWKNSDLWVLMKNDSTGELVFQEYSRFGILQGKVIIK
ncbi:MAG: hypothetical protein WC511_03070 [Candidatus Pacearchaeota archaeon]